MACVNDENGRRVKKHAAISVDQVVGNGIFQVRQRIVAHVLPFDKDRLGANVEEITAGDDGAFDKVAKANAAAAGIAKSAIKEGNALACGKDKHALRLIGGLWKIWRAVGARVVPACLRKRNPFKGEAVDVGYFHQPSHSACIEGRVFDCFPPHGGGSRAFPPARQTPTRPLGGARQARFSK